MAPSAHLLQLPRELRDQIYGYLHHDTSFPCVYRVGRKRTFWIRHVLVEMRVHNAPAANLLLVCSQTFYEHSEPNDRYPVSIFMDWFDRRWIEREGRHEQRPQHGQHGAFKHSKQLTLLLKRGIISGGDSIKADWDVMTRFIKSVLHKSVNMTSVRIVIREGWGRMKSHAQPSLATPGYPYRNPRWLLPAPSNDISDLPLLQIGQGFHTEFSNCAVHYKPTMFHSQSLVGVYLYGYVGRKHQWWSPENIVDCFLPRLYPQHVLDTVAPDERDALARLPDSIRGWIDRRGEDVKNWDGFIHDRASIVRQRKTRIEKGFASWLE